MLLGLNDNNYFVNVFPIFAKCFMHIVRGIKTHHTHRIVMELQLYTKSLKWIKTYRSMPMTPMFTAAYSLSRIGKCDVEPALMYAFSIFSYFVFEAFSEVVRERFLQRSVYAF